jgi:hypothetical protein
VTPSFRQRTFTARLANRLVANLYWLLAVSIAVPAFVRTSALYDFLKALRLM